MKKIFLGLLLSAAIVSCSRQQYSVIGISAQRYPINKKEGLLENKEVKHAVLKYKNRLDSKMSQVIGYSEMDMPYGRGETLLTNFTSDVMLDYARRNLDSECSIAFMNVYGHRSAINKGDITLGNIFEVYSFDNTIATATVKGVDLLDVFKSYAKMGGAGVSSTARLLIKDNTLINVTVEGKAIDPDKIYTIVTLDYLAEGNDGMDGLKNSLETKDTGVFLRDIMLNYIKEQTSKGKLIGSRLDGRITIEK